MAAALLLCVSQVSVTALAADTVYVDCDVLRCRSTAEINDTNIVTNLYYGEKLQRVGTEGEWTVVLVDGKNRYVSTQYLSETAPTGKAAGNGAAPEEMRAEVPRQAPETAPAPAAQAQVPEPREHCRAVPRSGFPPPINTRSFPRLTVERRRSTSPRRRTARGRRSASMRGMEPAAAAV